MRHACSAMFLLFLFGAAALGGEAMRVENLRCEYRNDPLGVRRSRAAAELDAPVGAARPAADGLPGASRIVARLAGKRAGRPLG